MSVPELICFDLPCLIDIPSDVPAAALDRAVRRLGVEPQPQLHAAAAAAGLDWPGRDARRVMNLLFRSEVWADAVTAAYDDAFAACVVRSGARPARDSREVVAGLRAAGAAICVTSQFSASTREAVLDVVGWWDLVAMMVSANPCTSELEDSVVTTAVSRAGAARTDCAVVSATGSGVAEGRDAGVGWVVGLLGGRATAEELSAAGATCTARLDELLPSATSGRLVAV